ncbi:MAG: PDZ domain-containing protein, partial [Pyrinomonadaceae bacterium]|nr:PDZ domain-containing protein [Pyrinomonadaceae bacterium]
MARYTEKLDAIAGIETEGLARLLERAAFVFLLLMAAAAPHSIAATQTAWLLGLVCTVVRLFLRPRPVLRFGWLEATLGAFVAWSVVSAVFSYEPAISLDKLRGVGLFVILYFAVYNLRSLRAVRLAAFVLIASAMVNVVWTPLERIIGRGVEIHGVRPDGPLGEAGMTNGDTILKVNGRRVGSPEEVVSLVGSADTAAVTFHRPDADKTVTVRRADLINSANAAEALGIESWKKSRKWRAKGFYGHFTTYSEVLQLIGSLVLGLLIAAYLAWRRETERGIARRQMVIFAACFGLISLAMLLSGTRASQLGLMISGFAIVAAVGSRRFVIAMIAMAVPVGIAGYAVLQQ